MNFAHLVPALFLRLATIILITLMAIPAHAQYPEKPIRLVVQFPAGGIVDLLGRTIAQNLSKSLGQPVIVENKPGADGILACDAVAKAPPDGYTLLLGNMALVPILHKAPPFDSQTAFTPIALAGEFVAAFVAYPGVPVKTMKELIEYVRANPGKIAYAAGSRTAQFATEELMSITKMDMVNIPYKGDVQAIPDLLTGQVQFMFANAVNLIAPHVKDGKLRALATIQGARSPLLPDTPTMAELGIPNVSITSWVAIFGPANLPKDIAERLSREVNAILKRPEVRDQMAKNGIALRESTPDELGRFVKEQTVIARKLALKLGLKPE